MCPTCRDGRCGSTRPTARPTSRSASRTIGKQLAEAEVPRTHAALAALLGSDTQRFRGRVATYDIERAGIGFLMAAHDAMATPRFWELVRSLGACQASLHADTQSMLESVAAGRSLLAYNVLGTYAEAFARRNPDVGVVYPSDYTLVLSRVAFIARNAPNPQGARLWLDHLLSPQGQRLLADAGGLFSVRTDSARPPIGPRGRAATRRRGSADRARAGAACASRPQQACGAAEALAQGVRARLRV